MPFAEHDAATTAFFIAVLGCFGILGLACLVAPVGALYALMFALRACPYEHRLLNPGLVWLNLLPVFNLGWQFWTVRQVSRSLNASFESRGLPNDGLPFTRTLGLTACWVVMAGVWLWVLVAFMGKDQIVQGVSALLMFILPATWVVVCILYWVRIVGLTRRLRASEPEWEFVE